MLSPRFAISAIFFVNGFTLAGWVSRIPAVTAALELSQAELGTALLGMAIGALMAFPVTGYLITRFGSARVTVAFGLLLSAALPLLALAPNLLGLFLALLLFGLGNGGMDVAMNAQGVEIERSLGKPILSGLHGYFSLGGLAGASFGAAVAGLGIPVLPHFAVAALLPVALLLLTRKVLLPDAVEAVNAPVFVLPPRALWGLGAIAFCAAVGEGAMADWSALYLRESLHTDAGTAALGYAAFSLTMLIGRFSGDALVARFGAVSMIRLGGLVAALGLGLGLFFDTLPSVLFGFGAVGLGLSVSVPLVFGAAGRQPDIPRGTAVAAVATLGYSGFLAGPPLLGWLAEWTSLRLALMVVVLLAALIVVLAGAAQREPVAEGAGG
jgi:MFS family permease